MIGAYDKDDGEILLLMLKDTLIWSMADDDMCPALTLGLYMAKEQSRIVEDAMDHKIMVNILKKFSPGGALHQNVGRLGRWKNL